jgi:hypothetical protein
MMIEQLGKLPLFRNDPARPPIFNESALFQHPTECGADRGATVALTARALGPCITPPPPPPASARTSMHPACPPMPDNGIATMASMSRTKAYHGRDGARVHDSDKSGVVRGFFG